MRVIPRILFAVLVLMLCTSTVAAADRNHDDNGRISVIPAVYVGGSSGGELLGERFSRLLAIPASTNPLEGNDNLCMTLGHRPRVASPAGGKALSTDPLTIKMSCTIKEGQSVLLVGPSAECSSAEHGEFGATTAEGQRKCALKAIFGFPSKSLVVKVDRSRPVDIYSSRFLTVSPQGRTIFDAKEPAFGADPGKATFVGASWVAEIRGMGKGDHTVRLETALTDNETVLTFVVRYTVVGDR